MVQPLPVELVLMATIQIYTNLNVWSFYWQIVLNEKKISKDNNNNKKNTLKLIWWSAKWIRYGMNIFERMFQFSCNPKWFWEYSIFQIYGCVYKFVLPCTHFRFRTFGKVIFASSCEYAKMYHETVWIELIFRPFFAYENL